MDLDFQHLIIKMEKMEKCDCVCNIKKPFDPTPSPGMQFLSEIDIPGLRHIFCNIPVFIFVIEVIDVIQNSLMVQFQVVRLRERQFTHRSDDMCTGHNLTCSDFFNQIPLASELWLACTKLTFRL